MAKAASVAQLLPASEESAPAAPTPKVETLSLFTSAFGSADGYGNAAEQIALALEKRGVKIGLSGPTRPAGYSNAEHIWSRGSVHGQAIVWFTVPGFWERQRDRRPSFGFSMYESTILPAHWLERLTFVDEVWVPCKTNQAWFAAATSKPVHLIPLGVNATDFPYRKRVRGSKLRILWSATYATEVRKNIHGAIRAFQDAFPDRDDVELILRSSAGSTIDKNDARITLQVRRETTAALNDTYGACDALIHTSFGEGFSLVPLEAMATGMPAIFANAVGQADYADLGMPVGTRAVPALAGHGTAPFGDWREPNHDELVERLREVDQHYDRVMAQAAKDAAKIARVWTWDRTAALVQARLEA